MWASNYLFKNRFELGSYSNCVFSYWKIVSLIKKRFDSVIIKILALK